MLFNYITFVELFVDRLSASGFASVDSSWLFYMRTKQASLKGTKVISIETTHQSKLNNNFSYKKIKHSKQNDL